MTASIFSRLQYDFDDALYGGAIYLTDGAKRYLNTAPATVANWQKDDIANGVVSKSRYYQNPHADVCATLLANTIIITSYTGDAANTFTNAPTEGAALGVVANNFIIQINAFKSHTDNISGLTAATETSDTIPTYDMATSYGQQLLRITNVSDGVQNAAPMLGSLTSLFIGNQLASNNTTIYNDRITLDSSIVGGNCNLTSAQVNTIISHISTANALLYTRRTHDWTFYTQARGIVNDYNFVSRFTPMGNTQSNLVENLIGTSTLKSNLANG
jgi:hypothetical protein